MVTPQYCPIETTLKYIGKKWTINIIRDLYFGKHKFSDFLKANPELSTKMLSARLKELEQNELVEKKVTSVTPLVVEYHLTTKGKALKPILYEFAKFAGMYCKCECANNMTKKQFMEIIETTMGSKKVKS